MASPFSLEEKQALLETKDIFSRKNKFEEILKTYVLDNFSNTTNYIKSYSLFNNSGQIWMTNGYKRYSQYMDMDTYESTSFVF